MTPICKLEVHQLDSNYRPIFFLSVFSKLHEKRVYSCLYAFLAKYKLLFEKQFGFRNNLSTNYAIISLIDLIDKDYFVCGLFINYQKAIDTVNHEIILIKLAFYGIRGLSDSWLKSFLENRKQNMYLLGYSSSVKIVTSVVLQGSTSGFFPVFSLHKWSTECFFKSFVHHCRWQ